MPADTPFSSLYYSSSDGLKLHARVYGPRVNSAWPVICLPGLARTAADFHELASTLASNADAPRRVISLDYRGRGLSDHDPDPANYDLRVENADIQTLLTVCDIGRAAFIGTSRGGMHVMALSALKPCPIAAAVINDIGPVIEKAGLLRIKTYVGKMLPVRSLEEAAESLKTRAGAGFSGFGEREWIRMAERSFIEKDGVFATPYDPALISSLKGITQDQSLPPMWDLFDGLAEVPLMMIRGENSDILSAETLAAMSARRADLETLVIPGQGHAPPLWEPDVIARITDFVDRAERDAEPRA